MLAKHGHTEARSTERQQHNPESDTENTTSIIRIIILSKTCRLILLFFFFSFLFLTYLLHIKSCKENGADSRSSRTCQGTHTSVSPGEEGGRGTASREEGPRSRARRGECTLPGLCFGHQMPRGDRQ